MRETISYELELKKLDFDRKQMMRRRGMSDTNYRYAQHQSTLQQQHSLESMASSSDQFIPTDPFQQTPPRVQLRSTEPDTKVFCLKKIINNNPTILQDSPKSLHLLGSLLVNSLVDSNSPQRTVCLCSLAFMSIISFSHGQPKTTKLRAKTWWNQFRHWAATGRRPISSTMKL